MKERTFEDIIHVMAEDESWNMPMEERPMALTDFAWTLNEL